MAHSYLSIGDKVEMFRDSDIVLAFSFLRYINEESKIIESTGGLRLLSLWHDSDVYGSGVLEIDFLQYLKGDDYTNFLNFIDFSLGKIQKMEDPISKEFLEQIVGENAVLHFEDMTKDDLTKILGKIKTFLENFIEKSHE